tara:strand:+ start:964 stop:1851 length:888 start_codon:yes stop_codon:yes gene_type:complete
MKNELRNITIVLISYKSSKKLQKFINNIPKLLKILIIDNSKDLNLKKIFKKRKNINIFYKKNDGYGCSINFAAKKIKTPYFLVVQPDVTGINKKSLLNFYKYAKKLQDSFSVIGPHFIDAPTKGHYQTNLKHDIKKIHNIHGSTMFFNKINFNKVKGFDKNIFLYWEETDYTKKSTKKNYYAYQLNKVKVKHEKGKSVLTKNRKEKIELENLYTWHFIWSKYYFYNKYYGRIISILVFIPTIFRVLFRLIIYKGKNVEKYNKYFFRWNGLKSSLMLKKSSLRLSTIEKLKNTSNI